MKKIMNTIWRFRLPGLILNLLYLHLVCAHGQNFCTPDQFQCNNGNCIKLSDRCNGIIDCADGSDETFLKCHNQPCNQFRCTYGGCIPENSRCNGIKDCWDNTDETVLECGNRTELEKHFKNLQGTCLDDTEFQCRNFRQCLPYSLFCDGHPHCEDGSDEIPELCIGTFCSDFAFRCGNGACILRRAVCNNVKNCVDGTDELNEMCQNYNVSVPIIPPIAIPELKPISMDCILPNIPNIIVQQITKSVVMLNCVSGYQLVGQSSNECTKGRWELDWSKCVRVCKWYTLSHDSSRIGKCCYRGKCNDCKGLLLQDTATNLICAPGYKPMGSYGLIKSSGRILCDPNSEWAIAAKNDGELHCEPDCVQIEQLKKAQEKPWRVSIFKRRDEYRSTFDFLCMGTILNTHLVLTYKSFYDEDHTFYTLVEGDHTEPFAQLSPPSDYTHNISEIILTKTTRFTLLKLIQPLKFSATVRPICITPKFKGVLGLK